MIALSHPDMEWVPITAAMEGRVYGRGNIRDVIRTFDLDWEAFEAQHQEFYELGSPAIHGAGRGA
jgi:hypothetical protein